MEDDMKTMLILLLLAAAGFGQVAQTSQASQKDSLLCKFNQYLEHHKDPANAVCLSLIVPGMGNLYADDKVQFVAFAGLEAFLWFSYFRARERNNQDEATWHWIKNNSGQYSYIALMVFNRFASAALAHNRAQKANQRWQITFNLLIEP